jgi:hypothetical protein
VSFSIDDGWDNCGPVARAGNAAFGVYCRCGAWVARNISNGLITEPVVPNEVAVAYGSPELTRKLVDVGLWEAVDGGWLLVDYLKLNQSAAQIQARRDRDAKRKAEWREKQSRKDETRDSKGSHGVTPRGLRASFTDPKGSGARPPQCPRHQGQPAHNCGPCRAEERGAA